MALHGVRRCAVAPGDTVVVQGAGPVGLLARPVRPGGGRRAVVVVEPVGGAGAGSRSTLGADLAVAPGEEAGHERCARGRAAWEPTSSWSARGCPPLLQTAVDLARRGRHRRAAQLHRRSRRSIDAARWMAKEVRVVGAVAFTHEDVLRCMAFLADGRVRVGPLHTRTVGLARAAGRAVRAGRRGSSPHVKVLVDPRPAQGRVTAGRWTVVATGVTERP